jgi:hypothetical protein
MLDKNGNRGKIVNYTRYLQSKLFSFEGMNRLGDRNITPMDFDGVIEYGGKYFIYGGVGIIILEGKLEGTDLESGERITLRHVIETYKEAKKVACAVVFSHKVPPGIILEENDETITIRFHKTDNIVKVKDMPVVEFYSTNSIDWEDMVKYPTTVLEFINGLEKIWNAGRNKL